jgi:Spy/CpxP family protein refolding chaperone
MNQSMKKTLFTVPASLVLAAGLMLGQTAGSGDTQKSGRFGQHRGGMFSSLNLSDAQKEQAKSIFSSSRESTRALEQQLRDARQALNTAAKNGASDVQIDQLAAAIGPLSAQAAAAHAKAFAKFYAILTPEQKAQVGDRMLGGDRGMSKGFSQRRDGAKGGWRRSEGQTNNQL